ncbi:MAG: KH domain-containing protein [Patescibacteria group bacterium]
MKTLIEFLLVHLVSHPEDVVVTETQDEEGHTYSVKVNPEDMGRVIGRGGRVIKALRKIIQVKMIKDGIRGRLVVEE